MKWIIYKNSMMIFVSYLPSGGVKPLTLVMGIQAAEPFPLISVKFLRTISKNACIMFVFVI